MRTILAATALVLVVASTAHADDVAGAYDVKYEEVSTNCPSPLKYTKGKIDIKVKGTQLTVDIDRTPIMVGSPAKNGKVSAKSKNGPTMLDGMNGSFSVAGKITADGTLTLVMIGEYTANGKPLCSQSWNVSGARADASGKKKSAADGDLMEMTFVPALLSSR